MTQGPADVWAQSVPCRHMSPNIGAMLQHLRTWRIGVVHHVVPSNVCSESVTVNMTVVWNEGRQLRWVHGAALQSLSGDFLFFFSSLLNKNQTIFFFHIYSPSRQNLRHITINTMNCFFFCLVVLYSCVFHGLFRDEVTGFFVGVSPTMSVIIYIFKSWSFLSHEVFESNPQCT